MSAREQVLGGADAEPEHVERAPARPAGERQRRLADLEAELARSVRGTDAGVDVPVVERARAYRAERGRRLRGPAERPVLIPLLTEVRDVIVDVVADTVSHRAAHGGTRHHVQCRHAHTAGTPTRTPPAPRTTGTPDEGTPPRGQPPRRHRPTAGTAIRSPRATHRLGSLL